MSWLAFVWLLLTGAGMVHCAIPRARLSEKLGLAFPVSAGVHALIDFGLMEAWRAQAFWSALILSPFLLFTVAIRPRWNIKNWTWKDGAALLLIAAALAQVWTHVVIMPVVEWDAISMWLFKGKVIAIEGKLTGQEAVRFRDVQPSYPWNIPLMHAWFGRLKGRFSEDAAKGIVFMFFCSLLLILYSSARLRWERGSSLTFTAAYVVIPFALVGAFNRDADLILETLIAASIFLALLLQIRPEPRTAVLLAVTIFLTCWTKAEGIAFSLLFCAYLIFAEFLSAGVKKRLPLIAALAGVTAGIFAFWIPKHLFGSEAWFVDRATIPDFEMLPRAAGILGVMLTEMFNGWKWNFAWWLPLLLLWTRQDPYRLKWLFFGQLALYFFSYFFAPYPFEWHMGTSLSRVLLHVLPALFAWTVFAWPGGAENRAAKTTKP